MFAMEPVDSIQAVHNAHTMFPCPSQLPKITRASDDQQCVAIIVRIIADLDSAFLQAEGQLVTE